VVTADEPYGGNLVLIWWRPDAAEDSNAVSVIYFDVAVTSFRSF
jgi:hypothetical protein